MKHKLPVDISPRLLARQQQTLEGYLPLRHCKRLAEVLQQDQLEGDATVSLRFREGDKGRPWADGVVWFVVQQPCQRCLEPAEVALEVPLSLAFHERMPDEQGEQTRDAFVVDEKSRARVVDIIEDDMLLAVPAIPLHDEGQCSGELVSLLAEHADAVEQHADVAGQEIDNPFAGLAQMLGRNDNGGDKRDTDGNAS